MGDAVWTTARLAALTTVLLLFLATPLAWWLARGRSWLKEPVGAFAALPIVLPPSVLGFYLLLALSPKSLLMEPLHALGVRTLAFTFTGLVIGSVFYSLPFAVQPLRNAFMAIGEEPLEAAATLGAGPWDRFFRVGLPLARGGYLTASVLVFAHTVGEFGVVLMIGGAIPGKTQVISTLIYQQVESLQFGQAGLLSGGLLIFSFLVILGVTVVTRNSAPPRREEAGWQPISPRREAAKSQGVII